MLATKLNICIKLNEVLSYFTRIFKYYIRMANLLRVYSGLQSFSNLLKSGLGIIVIPVRGKKHINFPPRKRPLPWLPKQERVLHKDNITAENTQFIEEVIESKYGQLPVKHDIEFSNSPLKISPIESNLKWKENFRRTGLIAKKIGIYPMWLKDGKKVTSTLLQIVDNHVIKYISPEDFNPVKRRQVAPVKNKLGCLIVGADSMDPQRFTKEYCGLFTDSGVMPKRVLMRFMVSPEAALQPGTPLHVAHFKPGEYVDIGGKTVDRGFQGVMVRWGFKGMPASHGVTKTHRRPGNIGSGGEKARVIRGTKLPGHMGNKWRVLKGIQILRINTKYNVMWVLGQNLPGETNNFLHVYDTVLPLKNHKDPPNFPTYMPSFTESLPEELQVEDLHTFAAPTIEYNKES